MKLADLQAEFERMGSEDPLWAVLTHPDKRGGKWDPAEFFATGVADVTHVLAHLKAHAVPVRHGRALDFGCGAGRLSQALAQHFAEVVGVDIAESMAETARQLDHSEGRCSFVVNTRDDLSQFESASFDFVYTHITLQHMEPRYALRYIAEFARLLRPGGVVVFQVPVPNGRARLSDAAKRYLPGLVRLVRRVSQPGEPLVEMYAIPAEIIERTLMAGGVALVTTLDDSNASRGAHGVIFFGRKEA